MDTITYASVAVLPWTVSQINNAPIVEGAEFPFLDWSYLAFMDWGTMNFPLTLATPRPSSNTPISAGCALLKRPYFFRPFRFIIRPPNHISVRKPTTKATSGHRINNSSSEPFPASGET